MIYTQFDSSYLSRAIMMIKSIRAFDSEIELAVICYDILSMRYCDSISKQYNLIVYFDKDIPIQGLSTEVILNRSRAEYIWGRKSEIACFLLETHKVSFICYVDADIYFFQPPSKILDKQHQFDMSFLSHDFVKYENNFVSSHIAGHWSAQWVFFKNSSLGKVYSKMWSSMCGFWCGENPEDGRYGDQKYLEYFQANEGVFGIEKSGGCGPWNVNQYAFDDIIFYHFHGFRLLPRSNYFQIGPYRIAIEHIQRIYWPYLSELISLNNELNNIGIKSLDSQKLSMKRKLFYLLNQNWLKNCEKISNT
jgi:hypothetical protein